MEGIYNYTPRSNRVSRVYIVAAILCLLSPLNAKLNPICHLLALLGAQHILHVSRIKYIYIYIYIILYYTTASVV